MIAEPVTVATDYALGAVCVWLGLRLYLKHESQRSRAFWSAALLAVALTAFLGGTHHGFEYAMPNFAASWVWKFAVLMVGPASFFMLAGSATATSAGALRKGVFIFAAAKLIAFEAWMLRHDQFTWVIADTASTMAAVFVVHAFRHREPGSRPILAGVAVSALAAGVQASGLAPHPSFNHNDLYHVIQIAAMVLFYRGASTIRDWRILPK